MCCPVEHICLFLLNVLSLRNRPQEKQFSALSPVKKKTIFGVPGKVVYLHYTHYCLLRLPLCRTRCLSFRLKLSRMATFLGKSWSFCSSCVLSEKMFCCVVGIFFPTWCLCLDFEYNCFDSGSLYSYFLDHFMSIKIAMSKVPVPLALKITKHLSYY